MTSAFPILWSEIVRRFHLLHRRMLMPIAMPPLVAAGMIVWAIIDLFDGNITAWYFSSLVPGLALGLPFGRLTKVAWEEGKLRTIRDRGQYVILAVFIIIRLGTRATISNVFGDLSYAGDIALLVTSGTLFGRSLGLLWQIHHAFLDADLP